MKTTCGLPCLTGRTSRTPFSSRITQLYTLVLAVLLVALCPARAEEPEDIYLRIFSLIQQADLLNSKGQAEKALPKYKEAQTRLDQFKRDYPEWNDKAVAYRLNYTTDKVALLSKEAPAGAETQPTQTGTKTAAPSSTTQVKLLDAGAEPRAVLRLHPKAGDKQTLGATMKMAMNIKAGEMPEQAMKLPAITIPMDVTVKSVADNGDITYEMVMGEASLSDEPGAAPMVAEAMKSSVSKLNGLTGTGIVSNRGITKSVEMKMPADADPQIRQVMDQMKESFSNVGALLPEEAVGRGAKWEARMALKSQGMTIAQTLRYQLASIEGERLAAKIEISQSSANQKMQNPAMPGVKVDLTRMEGTGTGDLTLDLAQILPLQMTMDLHSEMSMGMSIAGQKQAMSMTMDLNMRLEGK
jgi:hypothetical protein